MSSTRTLVCLKSSLFLTGKRRPVSCERFVCAKLLVDTLRSNSTLTKLHLGYNPALDDACKTALEAAAESWNPDVSLLL